MFTELIRLMEKRSSDVNQLATKLQQILTRLETPDVPMAPPPVDPAAGQAERLAPRHDILAYFAALPSNTRENNKMLDLAEDS
ncbi:hypothetical protein F7725_016024 [Dissostichus mawsoni]|uniref:Uncharacterized protein n=1 Tax=Dissostichus mawsoni TaxID=36200 RepID=A0A7J5Y3G9_DISMA|nr:hypothetical protein F7725_016024 [Dissostichus mawsoni]